MSRNTSIINRKITVAVLCVSATMSCLLAAGQTVRSWHVDIQKMASDLDRHVSKIEKSLATSVWYLDKVQIQSSLEQIASDTGVTRVELVVEGKDGIFAQVGVRGGKEGLEKSWSIRNPQSGHSEEIATLKVLSTTVDIDNQIVRDAVFLVLTNGAKGFLVSLIFLYIIDRLVSQHIRDLMSHIYRFDVTNVTNITPIPRRNVRTKDEFDQLIDAFNDMQSSIHQARKDQLTANEDLNKSQIEILRFTQKIADSQITTSVMHDVNNLISAMNLIVLRYKRDCKVENAAEILPVLIQEMDQTTKAVMGIIKAQQALASGRGDVLETVTVDQIIQDAVAIKAYTLKTRNVALTITGDVAKLIVTRRFLVMSALVNCIKNARESLERAKPENPSISIEVTATQDEIIIKVKDNGLGASAETLVNLRSRGFTTKIDGHGFGIDGCRKNMVALGGGLDIESDGLGCGATSIIRLPIDAHKVVMKREAEERLAKLVIVAPPANPEEIAEEGHESYKAIPI